MDLLENKRIFVVEDNATNLAIISSILRRNGATVFYDRWGHKTVQKMLKIGNFDIILLDLMFPTGITGYDVYDVIQATPELVDIPVAIVSAADPTSEMPKVRSKGMQGFISKPIDHRSFPTMIATILEGTPVWGEIIS
jgi:CheY-like chemotaxis protein